MNNQKNIIFMGSPDFAVPALRALIDSDDINVIAVFSQPPRRANRGKKITKTPVHRLAEEFDIEVYTPVKLSPDEIAKVTALQPDFICVAAYGLILPKKFLEISPCLNIHPSKLPRWRGAAPIIRTIMAGDKNTACCIMAMDEGLDTGDILIEEGYVIPDSTSSGQLHDYMANKGAELLLKVIKNFDSIRPIKQSSDGVTYAHKIKKEEAFLDYENLNVIDTKNKILGLSPFPSAWINYNGKRLKIIELGVEDQGFSLKCLDGEMFPSVVQPEGKRAMAIKDF